MRTPRTLGAYLVLIGIAQITIYLIITFWKDLDWLFYFDPRFGLYALDSVLTHAENPGILCWLSTAWVITTGIMLLCEMRVLKTYVVGEAILALPSVIAFIFIFQADLNPAHGFSRTELQGPLISFIVATVIPLWSATRLLNQRNIGQ